jgi:hypothetical protein
MTPTDDWERRHQQRIESARRIRATEDGVAEWARLAGLAERVTGSSWCGHDLLGKRPNWMHQSTCSGGRLVGTNWWDHVRGFGRGRRTWTCRPCLS